MVAEAFAATRLIRLLEGLPERTPALPGPLRRYLTRTGRVVLSRLTSSRHVVSAVVAYAIPQGYLLLAAIVADGFTGELTHER